MDEACAGMISGHFAADEDGINNNSNVALELGLAFQK
jgi:hypothetical protein